MRELFVDNFAGGGGASTGIEMAIGRSVDIAINHDPDAIAMHKVNHPSSRHYCEDVWEVNPVEACGGNPVALAWFSPDCKHFSRAKGGKPVDKNIRGLAWVAVRWAYLVRPRVLMLENVPEIQTWGPLIPKTDPKTGRVLKIVGYGHKKWSQHGAPRTAVAEPGEIVPLEKCLMIPDKERAGETFEGFILALTTGIPKEHPAFKEMCDALEISIDSGMADALTKGLGYQVEYKTLKSCDFGAPTTRTRFYMIARCDGQPIVWPEPTHAPKNSKDVKEGKKLPYHTAAECIDWSIPAKSIFERDKPLAENTLRRIARGIQKFVIENPDPYIVSVAETPSAPTIMCNNANNVGASVETPLPTVTTGNRNFLVAPSVIPIGYGEHERQKPRVNGVDEPLGTVVSSGKHYLVAPTLIQYHSETEKDEVRGQDVGEPLMTQDTSNRYALSVAHIMTMRNHMDGQKTDEPLTTVSCSGAHHAEVQAFLVKYFSTGAAKPVNEPLDTITTKDRFGLVTIHGEDYVIVDIRMRMLTPRELFNAQGFPADYVIDVDADGKPYPKTKQVARCGNAVTPPVPAALVRANLPEYCERKELTA